MGKESFSGISIPVFGFVWRRRRNQKNTAPQMMATPATTAMTIPAIAPPESPSLVVPADTSRVPVGEGVAAVLFDGGGDVVVVLMVKSRLNPDSAQPPSG